MPRMPQRLLSESNEEQLRDQLEETSTTLTTEQATRLAELEERGGGSQRDEEVMSALTAELGYVPLVGSRVLEALDATLDAAGAQLAHLAATLSGEAPAPSRPAARARPRVVVLGTGWGAAALLRALDLEAFDVTIVSPRNYFLFTPMLAGSAVGTVEFQSITEPIRRIVGEHANYLEATATAIDCEKKTVGCQSVMCEGTSCQFEDFDVEYDHLVVAVGATTNTFGVPGVREHCIFLKQISDADKLRRAVGNCFERANLPALDDDAKRAALSFVIVGAGPTGVEFCGELRDFVNDEVPKFYPDLLEYVSITLLEATDKVLAAFDAELQAVALAALSSDDGRDDAREGRPLTTVRLGSAVAEVTATSVLFKDGETLPYGLCVWAGGNGPLPVVLDMIDRVPAQRSLQESTGARGRVVVDDWLRVRGTEGVHALGDCAFAPSRPLPPTAQVAAQQGEFLAWLLERGYGDARGGPVPEVGGLAPSRAGPPEGLTERVFCKTNADASGETRLLARPFQFLNLGQLAYLGQSEALAQISVGSETVRGRGAAGFALWRSVYLSKQVGSRNRILVIGDWIKTRFFGRDISRF